MSAVPPESADPQPPTTSASSPAAAQATAMHWLTHLCGALIAASAALPITPDGRSFLTMLRAEFGRSLLEGCMMLAGFGSPFLFGLAIALVALPSLRAAATELVRTPIGLMHGQLLLVSFVVWRKGDAVAAAALFGFAVIGAIGYARSGMRAPGSRPLGIRDTIRWGAMMVAGTGAWCELQRIADTRFGVAVHVMLVAAIVLVVSTSRPPLQQGQSPGQQA